MKSVSLTHTGMVRKENQDSVINLRDMKGKHRIIASVARIIISAKPIHRQALCADIIDSCDKL